MPENCFNQDQNSKDEKVAICQQIEPGILQVTFLQEDVILSPAALQEGWACAGQLDPDKKSKILLITAPYSLLDNEAKKEATDIMLEWKKVAVIVHSLGQHLLGQVIIRLVSGSRTIKVFYDSEKALKWLRED